MDHRLLLVLHLLEHLQPLREMSEALLLTAEFGLALKESSLVNQPLKAFHVISWENLATAPLKSVEDRTSSVE